MPRFVMKLSFSMWQQRRLLWLALASVIGVLFAPASLHAQATTWLEQRTTSFAVLYPEGAESQANEYAQFVDGVYDEISAVFGYRTPTPVVLRIYPSMALYYEANPLAEQLQGVVAHAHTGRREISVALPQTVGQSPDQIVNNVRHELAHIIATDLSGNKLSTAWQEGVAQYVEHPTEELDVKMMLLERARIGDSLFSWSEINQPDVPYQAPQISYPQSYSMVAFLVQRDGFATLRRFLEATKTSTGYRSALETAYGVSADRLEGEWSAQLAAFTAGGYLRQNATVFDSAQAEALIARGEYAAALGELDTLRAGLDAGAPELATVDALLGRAKDGQRALQLAADSKQALANGEYETAKRAAAEAQPLLVALGQQGQADVVSEYVALADEGLRAQQQLDVAREALRTLRVGTARTALIDAYTSFTRLGDADGAAAAEHTLATIERTQWFFVIGLLLLAAITVGWNVHRRVSERTPVVPWG